MFLYKLKYTLYFMVFFLPRVIAQPYIYYTAAHGQDRQDTVIRFDLNTGSKTHLNSLCENNIFVYWDPTQTYLNMSSWKARDLLYNWTINLLDTTKKIFFESDGALNKMLYAPAKHRLYAFEDTELEEPKMTILDELNNTVIDQRKCEISLTSYGGNIVYEAFFSRDESTLYFSYTDSVTWTEKIAYFSTLSNQISQTKELSALGWHDARMHIVKGRRGTGIISSIKNEPYEESHFTLYDFDTDTKLKEINILGIPSPFILGENKLLALAYEYTNDSLECNYTGKIMLYSLQTGGVLKTILFPPDGRIYCFDNYPNKLYYVLNLETNPQVYVINVDSISALYNVNTLSPAMAFAGSGGFTIEVLGKNLTAGSTVMWNGTQRTTTFVSDTLLRAEILAADIANAGAYKVTVKPADTTLTVTDTLVFSAVSALPKPIRLEVNKITYNANNTATAYYGYDNANDKTVYIPHGTRNRFTPGSENRGQPELFLPGKHAYAFKVENFTGTIAWHLLEREAKAKADCP